MPIYDSNGSANTEIQYIYDNNGTTNSQIGYIYDNNGTTNSLIYQAQVEKTQTIWDTSTHTGWWSGFGIGIANNLYRYYTGGQNEVFSPYIDLTNYTKITITLFVSLHHGGSVRMLFGLCPQNNPNNYVWNLDSGVNSYVGEWVGPNLSGTYDISSFNGIYRFKQMTVEATGSAYTYLGNSYFTYLE